MEKIKDIKEQMLRLLCTFLSVLIFTSLLRAAPLDRRQIPASAAWYIALDSDAARQSLLGQQLRDLWLSKPENAKSLEQARQLFGGDLTRDIHDIIVYGTTYAPDAGVVILHGKVDQPRIVNVLQTLPGYHSTSADGHTLYFWEETSPNRRHSSAGAFLGEDAIVIAPDATALTAALAVLEGKSPGLSTDSAMLADAAPGTIVQAAATGLAEAKELQIQSSIVRQCQSGSLCLGEQSGQVFVRGRIVTQSADTAGSLCDLITGARAMGILQGTENPWLVELLHPLKVNTKDKSVEVNWQYSSVELVKIIQTEQAHSTHSTSSGQASRGQAHSTSPGQPRRPAANQPGKEQ
jgi:hypothetical protein